MVDLAQKHIRHAHAGETTAASTAGGFVLCHGLICDTSRRIRWGAPPLNTALPYTSARNTTVKIG
ncbi:MAG: hypothetical protein WA417_07675 [Stellaceae bacterium]|jgi:hypothetical protein